MDNETPAQATVLVHLGWSLQGKVAELTGKKTMFLTSIPLSYRVKNPANWLSSKCQRHLAMALNIPLKDYV